MDDLGMDDLRTGEVFYVYSETSDKVDLCREPTLNSQTSDGQENVLVAVPVGSEVILESREVRSVDGHDWYKVRLVQDEAGLTGWMISDHLPFLIPVTAGSGNSYDVRDVYYMGNLKWEIAKLSGNPARGNKLSSGVLKYKDGTDTVWVTVDDWKAVAGNRYPLT